MSEVRGLWCRDHNSYLPRENFYASKRGICKECFKAANKSKPRPASRLRRIWGGVMRRCRHSHDKDYPYYGGRGISVCQPWEDFYIFEKWALEFGYNENLSIDRIDVNGNYEPSNCRWATMKEQGNNKRTNHFLEFQGRRLTISQWATELGVLPHLISRRVNRLKWSIEKTLTTPSLQAKQ